MASPCTAHRALSLLRQSAQHSTPLLSAVGGRALLHRLDSNQTVWLHTWLESLVSCVPLGKHLNLSGYDSVSWGKQRPTPWTRSVEHFLKLSGHRKHSVCAPLTSCFLSALYTECLQGTNQALFIFVFLAPCAVPGPGRHHMSAPCLQAVFMSDIPFMPFPQRALLQPCRIRGASLTHSSHFRLLAQEAHKGPGCRGRGIS
jgi:hypothetical protein